MRPIVTWRRSTRDVDVTRRSQQAAPRTLQYLDTFVGAAVGGAEETRGEAGRLAPRLTHCLPRHSSPLGIVEGEITDIPPPIKVLVPAWSLVCPPRVPVVIIKSRVSLVMAERNIASKNS